ncbi:MFS transporter [Streptomyces sp. Je 1-369]|uniref:MFS transporter n=1 Tax=Streptomyces sp. Je 1-369 TaxID=2966192 RepID=UPI0022866BF9|nr:MFS transporter [Streptomyces sp. Je 1-369]WAL97008.1 MFS transporter [Streptomyces sp. Je 1-369]
MAQTGETTAGPGLGSAFIKLWAANTTSALGTGLVTIAAPLFVASRTSDPLTVSAITVVTWIPWLLFTLPGGVFVDRVDRRRLMVRLDWARVAVMTAFGAAILLDRAPLWMLFVTLFLIQTGEVLFRSASQSMIPALVPHQLLERANGWLMGGVTTTQQMIAGPLGGFLFVLAASIPFLADAGTYLISAVLTALIPGTFRAVARERGHDTADADGPSPVDGPSPIDGADSAARRTRGGLKQGLASVRSDIADSVRFLMGQRILRTMSVLIGVLNITLYAGGAVLVLLAKERLHLTSVGYGLLMTCMAVGGILGSAFGDRLIRRVTATWTVRVGLVLEAVTHLVLALSHNAYLVGGALFALGVHSTLWFMVSSSLRQRLTPPEMMGRSAGLNLFIIFGGNAVGALLGGMVAKQFGLSAPYWIGFVVAVVVAATAWRVFSPAAVAEVYATPVPGPEADGPEGVTTAAPDSTRSS